MGNLIKIGNIYKNLKPGNLAVCMFEYWGTRSTRQYECLATHNSISEIVSVDFYTSIVKLASDTENEGLIFYDVPVNDFIRNFKVVLNTEAAKILYLEGPHERD